MHSVCLSTFPLSLTNLGIIHVSLFWYLERRAGSYIIRLLPSTVLFQLPMNLSAKLSSVVVVGYAFYMFLFVFVKYCPYRRVGEFREQSPRI